jgi:hypothetical protein
MDDEPVTVRKVDERNVGKPGTLGKLLSSFAVPVGIFGGVAIAGIVSGLLLAPDEASKEFYSAAASAIPVLLLTLAIQARFFALPTSAEVIAQFAPPELRENEGARAYAARVLSDVIQRFPAQQRFIERMAFGTALLGLLVVAEFAALHPLATGHPGDGNPELVYVALTTGFLMIGGLALLGRIETPAAPARR